MAARGAAERERRRSNGRAVVIVSLALAAALAAAVGGYALRARKTGSDDAATPAAPAASVESTASPNAVSSLPDWTPYAALAFDLDDVAGGGRNRGYIGASCDLTLRGEAIVDREYKLQGSGATALDAGSRYGNYTDACRRALARAYDAQAGVKHVTLGIAFSSYTDYYAVNLHPIMFSWSGPSADLIGAFVAHAVDNKTSPLLTSCAFGSRDQASVPAPLEGWRSMICSFTPETGEIAAWSLGRSATERRTPAAIEWAESQAFLTIQASSGDLGRYGIADDAFIYFGDLDDASKCRICSCNLDGRACTRQGATWIDRGRNATLCGSCSLPRADGERPH